jgi:NDP-sugar pyrophosphorylase family protein
MPTPRITAVILAGGQGARIRHLLPELPKPMAPVLGRPFLEWVVRFLVQQGMTRIIISTGHKADLISAHFNRLNFPGVSMICALEHEPLGTAGGFLRAAGMESTAPEAWLVCNGDSLTLAPLSVLWQDPSAKERGALLALQMSEASAYGKLMCRSDQVIEGFAEKQPGAGLINAGVYFLPHKLVGQFPSGRPLSFELDVFPYFISIGITLHAVPVTVPFLDIGTPENLLRAEDFIATNCGLFGKFC